VAPSEALSLAVLVQAAEDRGEELRALRVRRSTSIVTGCVSGRAIRPASHEREAIVAVAASGPLCAARLLETWVAILTEREPAATLTNAHHGTVDEALERLAGYDGPMEKHLAGSALGQGRVDVGVLSIVPKHHGGRLIAAERRGVARYDLVTSRLGDGRVQGEVVISPVRPQSRENQVERTIGLDDAVGEQVERVASPPEPTDDVGIGIPHGRAVVLCRDAGEHAHDVLFAFELACAAGSVAERPQRALRRVGAGAICLRGVRRAGGEQQYHRGVKSGAH